jgi:hypothetical protein
MRIERLAVSCVVALLACSTRSEKVADRAVGPASSAGDSAPPQPVCAADDDCGLTTVGEGTCCPSLCAPRALIRARAESLQAGVEACEKEHQCPRLSCAPLSLPLKAACVGGRCVARAAPIPPPKRP